LSFERYRYIWALLANFPYRPESRSDNGHTPFKQTDQQDALSYKKY